MSDTARGTRSGSHICLAELRGDLKNQHSQGQFAVGIIAVVKDEAERRLTSVINLTDEVSVLGNRLGNS